MRRVRSCHRLRALTDGGGPIPRQIAKLQDRRLGMTWRVTDIRSMLKTGAMVGWIVTRESPGAPNSLAGFILYRIMADEAEILSIAVRRSARRRGLAKRLLTRAKESMVSMGVETVFLEVSEANRAARALYRCFGFERIGIRHNYYSTKYRKNHNALVFRMNLSSRRKRGLLLSFPVEH